jgi:hypothetical protein
MGRKGESAKVEEGALTDESGREEGVSPLSLFSLSLPFSLSSFSFPLCEKEEEKEEGLLFFFLSALSFLVVSMKIHRIVRSML